MAMGMPCPSMIRSILVPKPPRERPNAWSGGSTRCVRSLPSNRALVMTRSRRIAGSPQDGGVEEPGLGVEVFFLIQLTEQGFDDAIPGAIVASVAEAVMDGLERTVALGQVPPGSGGMQDPEDTVDDGPVFTPRMSGMSGVGWRQEGLENRPLLIGEFVASHGSSP